MENMNNPLPVSSKLPLRTHQVVKPLGERPLIRMDKVPATKDTQAGVRSAEDIPEQIVDMSKVPSIKYRKGRFLGKGGFAKCYEVSSSISENNLACKIVNKNMLVKEHHREKMVQEIMLHRSLNHPHIVGFNSYFEDDLFVYIVLELCEKKSLMELSKRRRVISEPEARYFLRQICEAVRYLHEDKKIIHRDLKLSNIFISASMDVKIGDFGLATVLEQENLRKRTMCGTPNYIAPEVLTKKGHGFEVDIWSIGCILYTLLVGKPPFETASLKETYDMIRKGKFALPNTNLSPQAVALIRRMLQVDPKLRPTAEQILTDDFLVRCFVPEMLPTAALTMAPRFPSTLPRKPLQETQPQSQQSGSSGGGKLALAPPDNLPILVDLVDSNVNNPFDTGFAPINDLLRSLRDQLGSVLQTDKVRLGMPTENNDESEDPALAPMLFVIKWVDYSDKYGFGYQLSDDSLGVSFNDQTKTVLLVDGSLTYVSKDGAETYHNIKQYPEHLEKKVKLVKYFNQYMKENLLRPINATVANTTCIPRVPTLFTWFRTSRSVVMSFTNGTLQVNNFRTHRKIILCPTMGAFSIIEPGMPLRTYKLSLFGEKGCTSLTKSDLQYALEKLDSICGKI